MIHTTKALHLVELIAEIEASQLGQTELRPTHFFLGVLKTLDINLDNLTEKLKPAEKKELEEEILRLRNSLGEFILDAPRTRHFLRWICPKGDNEVKSKDVKKSDKMLEIFCKAYEHAKKRNIKISVGLVLYCLLQTPEAQIVTCLEKFDLTPSDLQSCAERLIR